MENGKWKIRIEDWWSEKMTRVYLIRSLSIFRSLFHVRSDAIGCMGKKVIPW